MIVTPLLLGQRLTMNPLILFLSLLFWGWLWGVAGFLLAVPLMVVMRAILEHSRQLRPFARLMSPKL